MHLGRSGTASIERHERLYCSRNRCSRQHANKCQTPCDLLLRRKAPTIGTVHFNDVTTKSGAPNIDSECRLTRLRNYLNGVDLSKLSEEMIAPFETEPPPDDAVLVLRPTS